MGETAKTLGAVLFPGFELLDVFGPLEMFGQLTGVIDLCTVAQEAGSVASAQGPRVVADHGFASCPPLDLLLIPGGIGTRDGVEDERLIGWLKERAEAAEVVMTVCTGTALLARTGLLDGRRATTNKMVFHWVAGQGPEVDWVRQARWVEDGKFFTSSGVSAGMDMALAVIAQRVGEQMSESVAAGTEYEWHRDPDWDPFAKVHGLV